MSGLRNARHHTTGACQNINRRKMTGAANFRDQIDVTLENGAHFSPMGSPLLILQQYRIKGCDRAVLIISGALRNKRGSAENTEGG